MLGKTKGYEGMAVLFVAQAMGIDLTLGQQLTAAAVCLIAAMGVAGVPEAGFVSLALVARGRSMTNVLSDMVLSILIDRGQQPGPSATG
jgi:Na+/H+-dicarboxylate symporter